MLRPASSFFANPLSALETKAKLGGEHHLVAPALESPAEPVLAQRQWLGILHAVNRRRCTDSPVCEYSGVGKQPSRTRRSLPGTAEKTLRRRREEREKAVIHRSKQVGRPRSGAMPGFQKRPDYNSVCPGVMSIVLLSDSTDLAIGR
jgi:hypothetical protein